MRIDPESEAYVLHTCLNYLRDHPKVAWAERMNTGGMQKDHTDRRGHTQRHFVKFSFKGCSDIIGQLKDGRFLAVETKRPDKGPVEGRLSEWQKDFLNLVEANNGAAFVTDSLEDLKWFMDKL